MPQSARKCMEAERCDFKCSLTQVLAVKLETLAGLRPVSGRRLLLESRRYMYICEFDASRALIAPKACFQWSRVSFLGLSALSKRATETCPLPRSSHVWRTYKWVKTIALPRRESFAWASGPEFQLQYP